MHHLFGSGYGYGYNMSTDHHLAGSIILVLVLIGLVAAVLEIAGAWKVFEKAGEAGWKSIIPIYNYWVMAELAGKPGWWSLAFLLSVIPVFGGIVALVVYFYLYMELSKAFGKDPVYALLLTLLPFVGWPVLGFGDAKYVGQKYSDGAGSPPAATA